MQLNLSNYAEIFAAIVCTFCVFFKPSVTNRWFIGFLVLTLFVEFSAKLLYNNGAIKTSMYNIFGMVEVVFYLCYFRIFFKTKKEARLFQSIILFFLFFGIINFFFFQGAREYNHYTSLLGDAILSMFCLRIFYDILNDRVQGDSTKTLLIIVSGLFLYYCITLITDSFFYLLYIDGEFFKTLYTFVNGYLNLLLYGCFALAFASEAFNNNSRNLSS